MCTALILMLGRMLLARRPTTLLRFIWSLSMSSVRRRGGTLTGMIRPRARLTRAAFSTVVLWLPRVVEMIPLPLENESIRCAASAKITEAHVTYDCVGLTRSLHQYNLHPSRTLYALSFTSRKTLHCRSCPVLNRYRVIAFSLT